MTPQALRRQAIAEAIVESVLFELSDRKGFDGFWDDIDLDIQTEIIGALQDRVDDVLEASNV